MLLFLQVSKDITLTNTVQVTVHKLQKHSLLLPKTCDCCVKAHLRDDVLAGCQLLRDHHRFVPNNSNWLSVGKGPV